MPKTLSLQDLASLTQATLVGDPQKEISGVDDLECADETKAAFLANPRYEKKLIDSRAGVVFVSPDTQTEERRNYLVHKTPSLAFQKAIEFFIDTPSSGFPRIHPSAVIHESASVAEDVEIAPHVVIDQGVVIGKGCVIGAHTTIAPLTSIGEDVTIGAHVTICDQTIIHNRVRIQPGAVIGSAGFGYHTDGKGKHIYLEQRGNVVLEDDVEIGSNTTIDRARFKSTIIGAGTKVDNLVQIAHQVELGKDNIVISQAGIAGSTKTGHHVIIGGQVGVIGHLTIADETILAARTAVAKSIKQGGIYSGVPATPIREYNEQMVLFKNLPKLVKKLKKLEKQAEMLEQYLEEDQS